jgi:hypothetical protein
MKRMSLVAGALLALGVVGTVGLVEARERLAPPTAETMLARASKELALDSAQQARLLPLLRRGAALRAQIRNETEATLRADREELQRADADLAALSADHQARVDARIAEVRELRGELLDFYEHALRPEQQAKARAQLLRRIDRFEQLRERLLAMRDDFVLDG